MNLAGFGVVLIGVAVLGLWRLAEIESARRQRVLDEMRQADMAEKQRVAAGGCDHDYGLVGIPNDDGEPDTWRCHKCGHEIGNWY